MADPKIRYDILANAEGEEDVKRLANELEKLDDAIDPTAAARARELAQSLTGLSKQQSAINTFGQLKTEVSEARTALDTAQQAAQRLSKELSANTAPTRLQAGQLAKLRDAVTAAKTEVIAKTAALDKARGTLTSYGISTDNLAKAQLRVRAEMAGVRGEATQLAARYQQTAAAAAASAATQVAAQGKVKTAVEGLNDTYRRLQGIAAVAIGGGIFGSLIKDVSQTADEFKNLESRIKLVTGEGAAFDTAFQGVSEIANSTNTRLETTGTLFARIAQAGKDINLSQQGALQLTETINQAIAVSGGSAQAADAAITQLIQGLQSGVLRGEEFNSVVEQSPRLAKALADGLGVGIGKLRELAQQGKLTSDIVINALQGQSDTVAQEFAKLPPTVGRALTTLSNNWTLYVGEVDKANGISEAAAKIITTLADNLDTLGTVLITVGKAAAAYQALKLAQTFLGIGTAARAATVEVAALGAAQASTNAATASTAANAGRFAAILGGLKTFTLVGILANYKEIGTAIGEGAAKLLGYGKAIEESERQMREEAETARANAKDKAAYEAQTRKAAEAALGLSEAAKTVVGEFDQVIKKGDSTSAALDKVAKSLELGDITGIQTAGIALDALGQQGKITGDQIRNTLGAALKDLDLGTFEAQARAAFDSSEQGVRRLTAALDAMNDEALRRAGTSVDELRSGFSKAATSAINDVDKLVDALQDAGADAATTGRLLSAALNKASDAATTEKAVQAVITRLEELAKQGKITGEQLAAGLEAARKKLDEMKPGITSLAEAYRQFGLTSRAELQALADKNRDAWQVIRNDATLSLAQKQQAFKQYAEAAIAANGGVASSEIKVQAAAVGVEIQTDKTGKAIVRSMGEADAAVQKTAKRFNELGQEVNAVGDAINQLAGSLSGISAPGVRGPGDGAGPSVLGPSKIGETGSSDFSITTQVQVPPGYYFTLDPYDRNVERSAPGGGYFAKIPGYQPPNANNPAQGAFGGYAGSANQRDGIPDPNVKTVGGGVTLNVTIGGKSTTINAASQAEAETMIRALEDAFRAGGG